MKNSIIIRGARQHNLKNIDLDIPKNSLVVITGVSGSGKSTLAFDTLYAEGQRRYVESLSSYARQFLELMEKPDVDLIEYLSPAISIEQKSISKNPRSTVGTITEIYDYMRLLFARVGDVFCPICNKKIQSYTVQKIVDNVLAYGDGARIEILAPVIRGKKGEFKKYFKDMLKNGFVRAYLDGESVRLEDDIEIDKNVKHDVSISVDRIVIKNDVSRRITDSIEIALRNADGLVEILCNGEKTLYSEKFACIDCGISIAEVEPRIFSFNNPFGACPACEGIGECSVFDEDAVIPDKSKSIRDGAVKVWEQYDNFHFYNILNALSAKYNVDLNIPWQKLSQKHKDIILHGVDEPLELFTFKGDKKVFYEKHFHGVFGELQQMLSSGIISEIETAKKYMTFRPCEKCGGTRLKSESLSVRINGLNIAEAAKFNIKQAIGFFSKLKFDGFKKEVADKIIREILRRLNFLNDVGIDYITMDRKASTLSGGEAQRIRLATQIGSGLTGVLYVLDEPSIGLHQRDNDMLIATLKNLRDIGNSVIVVEHDEDTIMQCDQIIDMGVGAGRKGGEVVFQGTPKELMHSEQSLTGGYLSGRLNIEVPKERLKVDKTKIISIKGAKEHNLKNINVDIPLGLITCVTGVSGSGKSTLILNILYPELMRQLYGSTYKAGEHKAVTGVSFIDKVIDIDQTPIGRTPRSNPVTYTDIFKDIRELFAVIPEAKMRGYNAGRFSFNKKGGRCEICQGEGYIEIEMHFLPDMFVKCDACNGSRYNRDTLDITYKNKNIAECLNMTVNQSVEFFDNIPKLKAKLEVLRDVGLGYIKLGQPATTLSGGEAQRVKLAKELMKRSTGKTLYLFDEPTTGLHFDDINKLVKIFQRLRDNGNSIVIIEHNLDVIKCADYIIDLGPEGGDGGGEIIFAGTPEDCVKCKKSYTGKYLKSKLK